MANPRVLDILQYLEAFAPASLSAEWDNSGFLVGSLDMPVSGVLVALDVTKEVVAEAVAQNCNLLITHHPLIFGGIKQVVEGDWVGEMLQLLIKNNIALISAHTNLDNSPKGVNFALAKVLGLSNIAKISQDSENPSFMGELALPLSREALIAKVKQALGLPYLKATKNWRDSSQTYKKIAVCGGAGADLWPEAKSAGADCLITAEGKHHVGLAAAHFGMLIIDGGHYGTENLIAPVLAEYLQDHFTCLRVVATSLDTDPWQIL